MAGVIAHNKVIVSSATARVGFTAADDSCSDADHTARRPAEIRGI
jgi:hypothetical protein